MPLIDRPGPQAPIAAEAHGYESTRPGMFEHIVAALGVNPAEFTLVECGSGKGNVVAAAAALGFPGVWGIELRAELHAHAVAALGRPGALPDTRVEVTLVCGDAREAPLPPPPLLVYAFNPFGPAIMAQMVDRLAAHHPGGGRLVFAYLWPKYAHVLDTHPSFARIARAERWAAWERVP
jgi:hypothetical protein